MPTDDELAETAAPTPGGDDVAQTATAAATPSALATPPRATLGRYRLERVLGQGGMGVVHAAFDPELERKVAVKVLRTADEDARVRLLREARALAKLSHAHVITVFDVGTADGEDFIAMELVDGSTLDDWIKEARPTWRQIVDAYLAAGRGLAAAHAEGLVHRDFKPSNVLRSKSGRILVTDFGLARAAGIETGTAGPASGSVTTTKTGAILGTPAYMAPEQWNGGPVTPATDQFAFCVALWEALAGQRPFRGGSMDELRTGVLAGPAQLDDNAVPRPLRAILLRGLAVDPAKRWPSMDALLAALQSRTHRRRRWGLALVAGTVAYLIVRAVEPSHDAVSTVADCSSLPTALWARPGMIGVRDADAGELVKNDLESTRVLRMRACTIAPAKLACLDAVLARLDAITLSALADRGRVDADNIGYPLVDPAMCDRPTPPRVAATTQELVAAFSVMRHAITGLPPATPVELALADKASEPCARAVALLARIENLDEREIPASANAMFRDFAAMGEIGPRCEDDGIKTQIAIAQTHLKGTDAVPVAEAALVAFPADDLRAGIEVMRAERSRDAERWDDLDAAFARALALLTPRKRIRAQLHVVREQLKALFARARPEDIEHARALLAQWLPIARSLGAKYRARLEEESLKLRWRLGDVAAADREIEALRAQHVLTDWLPPFPAPPPIAVAGEVVDEAGAPIANANVYATPIPIGDGALAAMPLYAPQLAIAHTDREGKFTLAEARGTILAQAGELRSFTVDPAAHVHLVLHPTSHLAGVVDLAGTPATNVWIVVASAASEAILVAPIRADGTFTLDGVPRTKVSIDVAQTQTYDMGPRAKQLTVDKKEMSGISLRVSNRMLYIVGRSADINPPTGALFWVFGKFEPPPHLTMHTLRQKPLRNGIFGRSLTDLARVPKSIAASVHVDDTYVAVPDRPDGALVVCGLGISTQQMASAKSEKEFAQALADLDLACVHVAADQDLATVPLPPLRKLKL